MAEVIERFPHARVLCDATAVGDPVVERLREALPTSAIDGLVFTRSAKESLIDGLAWMIDRATLKMTPDPQLLRELEHFEARDTGSGHTRLAAQGGYHDDLVVALALAARQLDKLYQARIEVGRQREF